MQPPQQPRRKDRIPPHADVQRAIAGFFEAVRLIPVRRVDGDAVAAVLQRDGDVDDEALGTADAEVRMDDDHIGSCCHCFAADGGRVPSMGPFARVGAVHLELNFLGELSWHFVM